MRALSIHGLCVYRVLSVHGLGENRVLIAHERLTKEMFLEMSILQTTNNEKVVKFQDAL